MDNTKIKQLLLRSNYNDKSIHFMYYNAAQDRKIVLLARIINIIVITIMVVLVFFYSVNGPLIYGAHSSIFYRSYNALGYGLGAGQ